MRVIHKYSAGYTRVIQVYCNIIKSSHNHTAGAGYMILSKSKCELYTRCGLYAGIYGIYTTACMLSIRQPYLIADPQRLAETEGVLLALLLDVYVLVNTIRHFKCNREMVWTLQVKNTYTSAMKQFTRLKKIEKKVKMWTELLLPLHTWPTHMGRSEHDSANLSSI